MTEMIVSHGLDHIIVADTRTSGIDGERGELWIGGLAVGELSGRRSFEEVAHLLLQGRLPDGEELEATRASLGEAREAAFERLGRLGDAMQAAHPMDGLRAMLAHLPEGSSPQEVIGAAAVFAGALSAARRGVEPVAPDRRAGHAADYARMATGSDGAGVAQALDAYLSCVMDHGMNASTFTARVVASTGSDLVSAVVAAVGALKGPLHGGAPGPVLDMLDAVDQSGEAAERWIEAELAAGRRIMGMGHRVYRARDPRAAVLERAIEHLEGELDGPTRRRLELARRVERAAEAVLKRRHPDRPLRANVEFYTAVLLEAAGIPREAFTTTFATGRVVGWCAHVAEQRLQGRLIRPRARYVASAPQSGGVG